MNRLVVRFAREGAEVVAGWRGEVNVPNLTQVRPDLLVQVSEGTPGSGDPLHRVRATGGAPQRGGVQAGTLPPDGRCGQAVAPADGVRDGAGEGGTSGPPPGRCPC